jgi:iron complex outermembrane receptor protein
MLLVTLHKQLSVLSAFVFLTTAADAYAQKAPPAPPAPPAAAPSAPASAPEPAPVAEAPPVYETIITATTPLHGSGLPRDRAPSNVQTATGRNIAQSQSIDLSEFMNDEMGSVNVNGVQDNPLQPDLQYRGFLASPLLGAPQGLSIYLNGVRLNEVFGDTVNWDLLPSAAIRTVNLMPGSNPLFGLNTLGGAVSLETKTGFSDPGAHAQLMGGSFNRRSVGFELGAHGERWAYYVAADLFKEDGWRQFSSSEASRALLDTTYNDGPTTWDLTLNAADSDLNGNGASPVQLLAQDRSAIFTWPDRTQNHLLMATLRGEHAFSPHTHLAGLGYFRRNRTVTSNGDQGEWTQCQAPALVGFVCSQSDDGTETVIKDQAGNNVPYDTVHPYDGADNGTNTLQYGYGLAGQLIVNAPIGARENQFLVGVSGDQGRANFTAQSALARLSSTRGTQATDFVDPSSLVDVDSLTLNLGVFASDTFALLPHLFLTGSARFNVSTLSLTDQLGDDLNANHSYLRVNPALGFSYQPHPWLGVFGGYSESTRAPTPLELTCASPTDPCRLPNDFVADPPLQQVVARTFEVGLRGRLSGRAASVSYDLAAFRTVNSQDIIFISAGPITNQGYFANVGQTRRQGVEAGLSGRQRLGPRAGQLQWSAHYTFLDATFQTPFSELSANHPDAVDGALAVPAGARLPSSPRHIGKATVTWLYADRLALGANLVANSSQFLRGDEANLLAPIAGYVVVDLRASYAVTPPLSVFVKVSNLFDAHYSTFGVLGDATAVFPTFDNPRFEGPAGPRAAWAGIDLRYQ